MTIRTTEIKRYVKDEITEYIACDDKIFKTEQECLVYEEKLKRVNSLIIDNPNGILPYDVWVDEESQYIWVDLKTQEDVELVSEVYNLDDTCYDPGIYCIQISEECGNSMSNMKYYIESALKLLEFAGYDISNINKIRSDYNDDT